MEASVQQQARQRFEAVAAKQSGGSAAERGTAFGEFAMLLHAAGQHDAAEPAYLNAQTLTPTDARWPYYLGHLYRAMGDTAKAADAFRRASERQPADVATAVWLGRVTLDRGDAAAAETWFERARSGAPRTVAALVGLGQVALERRDYRGAAARLEEALALAPDAASIHAPLAQAYRGLGDTARAEAQMTRWRNVEVAVPDPLMDRLRASLESALSYEQRGSRAADAGNFAEAARLFRGGLSLTAPETPVGRSLTHRLALALYMSGDLPGGLREFDNAIRRAPATGPDDPAARAHYGLGIILASAGRDDEAVAHLRRAVAYDANYGQAHLALADLLRRQGKVGQSLPSYRASVRLTPQAADARFGEAIGLTRLGRYADARAVLEEAVRALPTRPELSYALARLLAAAPDATVRDGERALAIAGELLTTSKRTEVGETMAMALAETGQFEQAAGIQRGVMDAARRAGLDDQVRRMSANLQLYERHRPSRQPWAPDDPIHRPGPPTNAELARRIRDLGY